MKEVLRSVGRNRIPRLQVGIADAFLGVLTVADDVVCQLVKPPPIGIVRVFDGIFVSCKEQFYDFAVFHYGSPHM